MTAKQFNARHGLSVGSTPIEVIDSTGLISSASIPNLDAEKITSGIISAARLPSLTSTNVTTALGFTPQTALVSGTNIKTINGNSVLGSGNIVISGGVSSLNNRTGAVTLNSQDITSALGFASQAQLVSGTNIKTLNGQSVLGSGNLIVTSSFNSRTGAVTLLGSDVTSALGFTPQTQLISSTNIKTINGQSVLGSGNISISGGSGGGADLSAVAQNITPATTATHSLGSENLRWSSINASDQVVLKSAVKPIGTVTGISIDTTQEPVNLPSAYSPPTPEWGGLFNANIFLMTWENPENMPSDPPVDPFVSGSVGFGLMSGLQESVARLAEMANKAVTFSGNFGTFTLQMGAYSEQNQALEFTATGTDAGFAYSIGTYNLYVDWYDVSLSYTAETQTRTITLNNPATQIPSSAFLGINGSSILPQVASLPLTQISSATPVTLQVNEGINTSNGGGSSIYYISVNVGTWFNGPYLPPTHTLLQLRAEDNIVYHYFNSNNSTAESITFKLISNAQPENWGSGIFRVNLEAEPVSASNSALNSFIAAKNWGEVSNITNLNFAFFSNVYIAYQSRYVVPNWTTSGNSYVVTDGSADFITTNTVIGVQNSPSITLGSVGSSDAIDILYNIKTKTASYGGLVLPVAFGPGVGGSPGLISTNSQIGKPGNEGYNAFNSIVLGNNAFAGNNSVAIGSTAGWQGFLQGNDNSVQIGPNTYASSQSIAIGSGTTSTSTDGIALGSSTVSNGRRSLAVGFQAYTTFTSNGDGASAVGAFTRARLGYSLSTAAAFPWFDGSGRNQTVKFQLRNLTSGQGTTNIASAGTYYLTETGAGVGPHFSLPSGIPIYEMFAPDTSGASGLCYGTAVVLLRAVGTIAPVSAFVWKVVEIKFALYMHKFTNSSSSTVFWQNNANYELQVISTTTLASSADTGHTAWTPSIMINNGLFYARLVKTDSVDISATAKFELEFLNSKNPTS
jgi:hypothetical protein